MWEYYVLALVISIKLGIYKTYWVIQSNLAFQPREEGAQKWASTGD